MRIYIRYIMICSLLVAGFHQAPGQQAHAGLVTPSFSGNSSLLPVAVKVLNDNQEIMTGFSGDFVLTAQGATLQAGTIRIRKGVGSVTAEVLSTGDFTLSLQGIPGEELVVLKDPQPVVEIEGELTGASTWTSNVDYLVTGDLVIPAGSSLTVEKGVNILLANKVNISVYGNLTVEGKQDQPVLFAPQDESMPWGGIQLYSSQDTVIFENTFFILGGGNEQFQFGHSESQPVVLIDAAMVRFTGCCFLDNPGKALGGIDSRVKINDCIISRCDTGGEYHGCEVGISGSWFTEIPDGDGQLEDDDNDCMYIAGNHPQAQAASLVTGCYFLVGEDDGIDHNGATLNVMNCWIEGFAHEGIAASSENTIRVYNTLVRDCEQGIEAGYGSPQVEVDHCTLVDNQVGIRFGDSYAWGCEGHMQVTNSILYANADNVLNYDLLMQGPVAGAVDISYTMTNDPEYNGGLGCVAGTPEFDESYLLLSGSFGTGLASDGSDLGLVNQSMHLDPGLLIQGPVVYPNPFTDWFSIRLSREVNRDVVILVHDVTGRKKYSGDFMPNGRAGEVFTIVTSGWLAGVYNVMVICDGEVLGSGTILKN